MGIYFLDNMNLYEGRTLFHARDSELAVWWTLRRCYSLVPDHEICGKALTSMKAGIIFFVCFKL